jgi:hypothetical protein
MDEEEDESGLLAAFGATEDGDEEAVEEDSPKRMALADFFAAGKAGDMEAAEAAFQRMYDLCAMKPAKAESESLLGEEEEY